MNIMDGIDKLKSRRHKGTPVAILTALGRTKLEKPGVPEYEWRVLNHLNEFGPSSVKDIANEQGIPEHKTKAICKSLEGDGFIKRAGAEG